MHESALDGGYPQAKMFFSTTWILLLAGALNTAWVAASPAPQPSPVALVPTPSLAAPVAIRAAGELFYCTEADFKGACYHQHFSSGAR